MKKKKEINYKFWFDAFMSAAIFYMITGISGVGAFFFFNFVWDMGLIGNLFFTGAWVAIVVLFIQLDFKKMGEKYNGSS